METKPPVQSRAKLRCRSGVSIKILRGLLAPASGRWRRLGSAEPEYFPGVAGGDDVEMGRTRHALEAVDGGGVPLGFDFVWRQQPDAAVGLPEAHARRHI